MVAGYNPIPLGISSDTTHSRSSSPARRAGITSHAAVSPLGSPSRRHQALHLHQEVSLQHPPGPTHAYTHPWDAAEQQAAALHQAERAVAWRVLPWLVALVMASFLDRTNLAFASVTMSPALGLSATLYGVGSGLFFLGYATCQIPSNLLLLRWGGPTWLATLAATWGSVAAACAAINGPASFLLLRLALGAAEAGAFPGLWYYVTCFWAPSRTTLPLAVIETGITASQVVAAPLSAGVLSLDGVGGLAGWRWLFLLEGLPALVLAAGIWWFLPPSVEAASFLTPHQKAALAAALAAAPHPTGATDAPCQQQDPQKQQAAVDQEEEDHPLMPGKGSSHLPAAAAAAAAPPAGAAGSPQPGVGLEQQQHQEQQQHHPHPHLHHHHQQQQQHVVPFKEASRVPQEEEEDTCAGERAALVPGHHHSSTSFSSHPPHHHAQTGPGSSSRGQGGGAGTPAGASLWQQVRRVVRHRVVLYAGAWRVLHDIPGYAVLYFTPLMVAALLKGGSGGGLGAHHIARPTLQAPVPEALNGSSSGFGVLSAASSLTSNSSSSSSGAESFHVQGPAPPPAAGGGGSGAGVVLLSAIPYAAASLAHVANAWHSAATGEWRWHIAGLWWGGAAALLLLPLASALHPAVGFLALTAAHIGVNGANGVQTGLVARCLPPGDKALGLAAYNSLGSLGGLVGPVVVGALVDASGGYGAACLVLGASLGAAGALVWWFRPEG